MSDKDNKNNEDLNEIDMDPENDLVTPHDKVQDGKTKQKWSREI